MHHMWQRSEIDVMDRRDCWSLKNWPTWISMWCPPTCYLLQSAFHVTNIWRPVRVVFQLRRLCERPFQHCLPLPKSCQFTCLNCFFSLSIHSILHWTPDTSKHVQICSSAAPLQKNSGSMQQRDLSYWIFTYLVTSLCIHQSTILAQHLSMKVYF